MFYELFQAVLVFEKFAQDENVIEDIKTIADHYEFVGQTSLPKELSELKTSVENFENQMNEINQDPDIVESKAKSLIDYYKSVIENFTTIVSQLEGFLRFMVEPWPSSLFFVFKTKTINFENNVLEFWNEKEREYNSLFGNDILKKQNFDKINVLIDYFYETKGFVGVLTQAISSLKTLTRNFGNRVYEFWLDESSGSAKVFIEIGRVLEGILNSLGANINVSTALNDFEQKYVVQVFDSPEEEEEAYIEALSLGGESDEEEQAAREEFRKNRSWESFGY